MNFYFAPMEGLSGYVFRNAHNACFNPIDKYFSPFVTANESGHFKKRELEDLAPEHNHGLVLIPQLLANKAKEFILFADKIKAMGYDEINLNLGCPSGTVTAKFKGAGFLAKRAELDAFLYGIFAWGGTGISIKTRIGVVHPDEFFELIEIFNKYPVKELTIHPRVRTDFYKNKPNMEVFRHAVQHSKNPLCFNGNIFTVEQYQKFSREHSAVGSVMLGRGLLVNPGLVKEIKTGVKIDKTNLKTFHDMIYDGYRKLMPGDVNTLYKMKEIWFYMILLFSDHEKYAKKIRKATRLTDYEDAVSSLFREQELLDSYEGYLDKV